MFVIGWRQWRGCETWRRGRHSGPWASRAVICCLRLDKLREEAASLRALLVLRHGQSHIKIEKTALVVLVVRGPCKVEQLHE